MSEQVHFPWNEEPEWREPCPGPFRYEEICTSEGYAIRSLKSVCEACDAEIGANLLDEKWGGVAGARKEMAEIELCHLVGISYGTLVGVTHEGDTLTDEQYEMVTDHITEQVRKYNDQKLKAG